MISLEHATDTEGAIRNFEKLARLTVDTGGVSLGLRVGASSLVWPGVANATSNTKTISHGLGRVPVLVVCVAYVPAGNTVTRGIDIEADDATFSATDFTCRGKFSNGLTSTATWPFGWIAIG